MKKGNESKRLYEDLWLKELLDFSDQSVILQKWQPVSYLDRGQFSRIFKVVNRQTGEEGALKFVPNPLEAAECKPENSPEGAFFLSRFKFSQQEAQIMQRFHSDSNIVQYCEQPEFLKRTFTSDLGETLVQYAVLICMPLYHNYKEWLPAVCGDRDRCIQVGKDIAKALMAFEEKGVYHRDIKPGNIMMDDAGTFYLGDVGEAKLESEFTTLGFHGTRPYMAPEVRKQENERSKMRSDHRSDIYSLGIILYRLFNHQQFPFLTEEGTLTEEATHMYARSEKSGLADVLPDSERAHTLRYDGRRLPKPAEADDALSRVILRACAHDRRERYQTAAELYEALDECQRCDASAILPGRRNCLSGRTARKIAMAGLVVLILAAGLSGWLVVSNSQLPTTPTPAAASETVPVLTPTPVPTPSPTPTPTPTPVPTSSPTPTPVPTPSPTPTPTPTATPSPSPTPTPLPVPEACTLSQGPGGISVQIPHLQHPDIQEVRLYRIRESGGRELIGIMDYPNEKNYVDTLLEPGQKYDYYYSIVCDCEPAYPDSQIASVRWTEYSRLSNLRVTQDVNDIRTIHVAWDDIGNGSYYVNIYQINDDGEIGLWEVEEENGTFPSRQMSFRGALPRTTYVVNVTDMITCETLSQTITIPPAPDYEKYGAQHKSHAMYWMKKSDLNAGKKPFDPDVKLEPYRTMTLSEFAKKQEKYALCGKSLYVYTKASDAHYFDVLYILRGPNGDVAYEEYFDRFFDAHPANYKWEWHCYPITSLIKQLSFGKGNLTDPGEYLFEVYFDGCRVSRTKFKLIN